MVEKCGFEYAKVNHVFLGHLIYMIYTETKLNKQKPEFLQSILIFKNDYPFFSIQNIGEKYEEIFGLVMKYLETAVLINSDVNIVLS